MKSNHFEPALRPNPAQEISGWPSRLSACSCLCVTKCLTIFWSIHSSNNQWKLLGSLEADAILACLRLFSSSVSDSSALSCSSSLIVCCWTFSLSVASRKPSTVMLPSMRSCPAYSQPITRKKLKWNASERAIAVLPVFNKICYSQKLNSWNSLPRTSSQGNLFRAPPFLDIRAGGVRQKLVFRKWTTLFWLPVNVV